MCGCGVACVCGVRDFAVVSCSINIIAQCQYHPYTCKSSRVANVLAHATPNVLTCVRRSLGLCSLVAHGHPHTHARDSAAYNNHICASRRDTHSIRSGLLTFRLSQFARANIIGSVHPSGCPRRPPANGAGKNIRESRAATEAQRQNMSSPTTCNKQLLLQSVQTQNINTSWEYKSAWRCPGDAGRKSIIPKCIMVVLHWRTLLRRCLLPYIMRACG